MTVVSGNLAPSTTASTSRSGKLKALYSPLWLCFLLAILVRVWLIVHTHGVMAGDEMEVGLQAEHILRGERPVYYFGQPYMGSLEAYLAAFIFLFTGPAVWAMRLETIPMSLLMVYLAWRFAAVLAETAHLSARLKTTFMTIAALVAAFPPLYDMAARPGWSFADTAGCHDGASTPCDLWAVRGWLGPCARGSQSLARQTIPGVCARPAAYCAASALLALCINYLLSRA